MCRPTTEKISTTVGKQTVQDLQNNEATFLSSSANGGDEVGTTSIQQLKSIKQAITSSHTKERSTDYDIYYFLGPAVLFSAFTNVIPIYFIGTIRILVAHIILSLHYTFVDKDNYLVKLSKKQIIREKNEYYTAFILHMWIQCVLQIIFPSMFFSANSNIGQCMIEALVMHIIFVEPFYYVVHRWLHNPIHMKSMHGFHHLSIQTLPTTALVQNFTEHIVYIITFGPSFFIPYLLFGRQHWVAIGTYLVMFDIVNTFGHTNIKLHHWIFTSKYSPITYLFYTPEFHLGHHAYFNANYALFMPMWDYMFGTARTYKKKEQTLLPKKQQDFVFIGHNGGLGHFFTIPELCFYKVYDSYPKLSFIPLKLQFLIMHGICLLSKLVISFYYCSRYCIANDYIGRIIVLTRSPWDYMNPKSYNNINKEIINLIKLQHKKYGTRYFGLGNLNKMKQLNDGGIDIVKLVQDDDYLRTANIRIWTGDTLTVASVYNQIIDIPNITELYYIGAGGKVGTGVCDMLSKTHPHIQIRIFSRNQYFTKYPNISYSTDLSEIVNYRHVLIGKILSNDMYRKAFDKALATTKSSANGIKTRFLLDYTVPAVPLPVLTTHTQIKLLQIQHKRVGLLQTTNKNNPFLKGPYDYCMSHDENHIVPCHFGCLLHTIDGRETNEVGDINLQDVERLWKMTIARDFHNITINYETQV